MDVEDMIRDWALWIYQADITNGAGGAGTHTYAFTVPAGGTVQILYGQILNGDTSNRAAVATILDPSSGSLYEVIDSATLNAGTRTNFPTAEIFNSAGNGGAAQKLLLGSNMIFQVQVVDVAASENTALGLAMKIWGPVPSAAETGASTPTINVNTELVA